MITELNKFDEEKYAHGTQAEMRQVVVGHDRSLGKEHRNEGYAVEEHVGQEKAREYLLGQHILKVYDLVN